MHARWVVHVAIAIGVANRMRQPLRSSLAPTNAVNAPAWRTVGVERYDDADLAAIGLHDRQSSGLVGRGPLREDIQSIRRPAVVLGVLEQSTGARPIAIGDVQIP